MKSFSTISGAATDEITLLFSSGVPLIGTSAFTGNDSGCSGMLCALGAFSKGVCELKLCTDLETSQINPTRSSWVSPNPRMPPEQTLMPASRTASIVSSRSSYDLVVMTFFKAQGKFILEW